MIYSGSYALLETAGVRLALVSDAPEMIRGAVSRALDAARVGFFCAPIQGGHVRVETAEGYAEANLLRAAAYLHAQKAQPTGVAFVLAEGGGYPSPQAVVANVAGQTASAVLLLPERLEMTEQGLRARFAEVWYLAWDASRRCTAEGAALAAIAQMAEITDGTMEVGAGGLEIGIKKEHGVVTGLSAGGPMRVLEVRVWECEA